MNNKGGKEKMRFKITFKEYELRDYDPKGKSIIVGAVIQTAMTVLVIAIAIRELGTWSTMGIVVVVEILFVTIIFPNIMYQFPPEYLKYSK